MEQCTMSYALWDLWIFFCRVLICMHQPLPGVSMYIYEHIRQLQNHIAHPVNSKSILCTKIWQEYLEHGHIWTNSTSIVFLLGQSWRFDLSADWQRNSDRIKWIYSEVLPFTATSFANGNEKLMSLSLPRCQKSNWHSFLIFEDILQT